MTSNQTCSTASWRRSRSNLYSVVENYSIEHTSPAGAEPHGNRASQGSIFTTVNYSALFFRRSTISPSRTTAITAQIIRTESIASPFLLYGAFGHTYDHDRFRGPIQPARRARLPKTCYLFPTLDTWQHPIHQMPCIIGINSREILTATGPTVTTKSDGRIQKKMGNTSLTPSLAAFSSATCLA